MQLLTDEDVRGAIADLGTTVTVLGVGELQGVFRDNFEQADIGLGIEAVKAWFTAPQKDIDALGVRKDTPVEIDGVTYRVRRIEPLLLGMARAVLTRP